MTERDGTTYECKVFNSYRELLADALSPKQPKRNADIVVVTDIQFQPSEASLRGG